MRPIQNRRKTSKKISLVSILFVLSMIATVVVLDEDSPGISIEGNTQAISQDESDQVHLGDDEPDLHAIQLIDDQTNEPLQNDDVAPYSSFEIHYIDVGQGDAALVLCDGEAMLIDGGDASQSSKIYTYLKEHNISNLSYLVASHADADHVGGLPGALNYAKVDKAFCSVKESDAKAFTNLLKYLDKQGVQITIPSHGDVFPLGSATVSVLGPQKEYEDSNNSSIVLKIAYGATTFLFTGDAEYESETDMLDSGCDLSATVLKVAHHGSNSSTGYRFLRAVGPQLAVISVGEDNPYGHPTETVLSRLSDADAIVYRTDLNGTIICRSDGSAVTFSIEKDAEEDAIDGNPVADEETYVGNINSKKFHRPSCSNLPAEKNRVLFETRNDALSEGYTPCENCKP